MAFYACCSSCLGLEPLDDFPNPQRARWLNDFESAFSAEKWVSGARYTMPESARKIKLFGKLSSIGFHLRKCKKWMEFWKLKRFGMGRKLVDKGKSQWVLAERQHQCDKCCSSWLGFVGWVDEEILEICSGKLQSKPAHAPDESIKENSLSISKPSSSSTTSTWPWNGLHIHPDSPLTHPTDLPTVPAIIDFLRPNNNLNAGKNHKAQTQTW